MSVNSPLRNAGISSVQVLIFMGLALGAFVLAFQLLGLGRKQQASVNDRQDLETVSQLSQTVLRNPWLCEKNLIGKTFTSTHLDLRIRQLMNYPRSGGAVSNYLDFAVPRGNLSAFVAKLIFAKAPLSSSPEPIQAQFVLGAYRNSESMGAPLIETKWPATLLGSDFEIFAKKTGPDESEITGCKAPPLPTSTPAPTPVPTATPGYCTNPMVCGDDAAPFCCAGYTCVNTGSTFKCVSGCVNPPSCVVDSQCCSGTVCNSGHCTLPPTATPSSCGHDGDTCDWSPTSSPIPLGTIPGHDCCGGLLCAEISFPEFRCRSPIGFGEATLNQSCGPSGAGRLCVSGLRCIWTVDGVFQCKP